MQHQFPRLLSFVIDDTPTVKDLMELFDLTDNLQLPLSTEAFEEFNQLQGLLPLVNLQGLLHDFWAQWLTPYSGGSRILLVL